MLGNVDFSDKLVLALAYFGSLALALANLVYDLFCPAIIKRFDSPNDMYHAMLKIADLSWNLYPEDSFDGSLKHCVSAYESQSNTLPKWRRICAWFFVLGACLIGLAIAMRSVSVLGALLC